MNCERCNKRLSRKTARQIDGVVMCSTCMFAPPEPRKWAYGGGTLESDVPGFELLRGDQLRKAIESLPAGDPLKQATAPGGEARQGGDSEASSIHEHPAPEGGDAPTPPDTSGANP